MCSGIRFLYREKIHDLVHLVLYLARKTEKSGRKQWIDGIIEAIHFNSYEIPIE